MFKRFYTLLFILFAFLSNSQNIYTLLGNGVAGFSGDGGPAYLATTFEPQGIVTDTKGNIYFAEYQNYRIRKISNLGIITTVAGTGTFGYSGDGGSATGANLTTPFAIAIDTIGNLYFSDENNHRIRKINKLGIITTIAGTGVAGYSGDGSLATLAQINWPHGITVDLSGNVYFTDNYNNRIRKINTSGIISTIAGNGNPGFSGDGGLATSAQIDAPFGIKIDKLGNIYFSDYDNLRVRKINTAGIVNTIAGNGGLGSTGDGGSALSAQIYGPGSLDLDTLGNIYIVEYLGRRVRKIDPSGIITAVAFTGSIGYSGDGGPAVSAQAVSIFGLALDVFGNIYLTDEMNHRIRVVCKNSCLAGINDFEGNKHNIALFPNPNNGSFKLQIDNEIKNGELILINSIGQKVYEQTVIRGENKIITKGFSEGLYNYILLEDKQVIHSGKLVIE